MARRKVKKRKPGPRPIKIAALIISAIQTLRETKGSTPGKIIDYITYASNIGQGRIRRQGMERRWLFGSRLNSQVKAALKRGVEYGILRRFRGHYYLPSGDDLDRANRTAVRFAKLPRPSSSKPAVNRKTVLKEGRKPGALPLVRRPLLSTRKNLRKVRSLSQYGASSASGRSCCVEDPFAVGSDTD